MKANHHASRKDLELEETPIVGPTFERCLHGYVERPVKPIMDDAGAIAWPFRTRDVILGLLLRKAISPEAWDAGEQFRRDFRLAHLDTLKAADLSKPRVSGMRNTESSRAEERARYRVMLMLLTLGRDIAAASCIWHVVGCEEALEAWRINHMRCSISRWRALLVLKNALTTLAREKARE